MQKRLRPTLRENKRYLLVKNADKKEIEEAILEMIGVLGYAGAGIRIIKTKKYSDNIVLAVNRESAGKIRTALTIKGIIITKVSGTINGLK